MAIKKENKEVATQSRFNLRGLNSKDLFLVTAILKKIGFKEIRRIFDAGVISEAAKRGDLNAVGVSVAIDIAGIVVCNLDSAQDEIFKFCASVSGMSEEDVANLPLDEFGELVSEIVRKKEMRDFFGQLLRFMKSE